MSECYLFCSIIYISFKAKLLTLVLWRHASRENPQRYADSTAPYAPGKASSFRDIRLTESEAGCEVFPEAEALVESAHCWGFPLLAWCYKCASGKFFCLWHVSKVPIIKDSFILVVKWTCTTHGLAVLLMAWQQREHSIVSLIRMRDCQNSTTGPIHLIHWEAEMCCSKMHLSYKI